jgi:hypothetical protein
MDTPPVLDYSNLKQDQKPFWKSLLLARIATSIALITCGIIEITNAALGFVLPLPKPPPDAVRDNWRAYGGEGTLAVMLLCSVCWLYPLVACLLISLPLLALEAPTRALRTRILIAFSLVVLAAISIFYRGYFSAVLKSID